MAGHPVQKGMDANLGSLDRVYEPWPLPVVAEVIEATEMLRKKFSAAVVACQPQQAAAAQLTSIDLI